MRYTQKLFTTMSSLVPSCTSCEDRENSLGETGYNFGSVATCEQTSVNGVAVRSHISLCLIKDNQPLWQDKATCITERKVFHMQAQCVSIFLLISFMM